MKVVPLPAMNIFWSNNNPGVFLYY